MSKSTENKMFECALTGQKAEAFELGDKPTDVTEGLPPEWVEITIKRRSISPDWLAVRQTKQRQLQSILMQVPEELRDGEAPYVAIGVEAAFAAYEARIKPYVIDYEQTLFVSPDEEATAMLNEILENFGVALLGADDEDAGDDE
jgi:hypothetical protein